MILKCIKKINGKEMIGIVFWEMRENLPFASVHMAKNEWMN